MEKAEMSEQILQAFLTEWLKRKLQELARDLGPMVKQQGLDSKEVKTFIFSLLEKSLVTLKKMDI